RDTLVSVRPDAFAHDHWLHVGSAVVAPCAARELPNPSPVRGMQDHARAVETQSDVGIFTALLENMAGKPHDGRRVLDPQLVALAVEPNFARRCGWDRHDRRSMTGIR